MDGMKFFDDGTVYWDNVGLTIKLKSHFYASNDIYCIARTITWRGLEKFPGDKNELIILLIENLQKEYEKLNGR